MIAKPIVDLIEERQFYLLNSRTPLKSNPGLIDWNESEFRGRGVWLEAKVSFAWVHELWVSGLAVRASAST